MLFLPLHQIVSMFLQMLQNLYFICPDQFIGLFLGPLKSPLANISGKERNAWRIPLGTGAYQASSDASLFSSSLPVLPHTKRTLNLFGKCSQFSIWFSFSQVLYANVQ